MRERGRRGLTLVAAAVALGAVTPAGAGAAPDRCGHAGLQRALDGLTGTYGMAGAAAEVDDPACGRWTGTSGLADVGTGRPMRAGERVRIGSTTKTFTATVVLQLAAEHRLALDASVAHYLPGLVRSNGYDGRKITVRELLQHTSGLPDHVAALDWDHVDRWRFRHFSAREEVAMALALPRPDRRWTYSTTNFVIAGMIIKKVTGHDPTTEITRRIIVPLGLHDTYWPGDSPHIEGPHPRGYEAGDDGRNDVTDFDMSFGGAGGALVSSLTDENRFFAALLGGRLLPPDRLAQMTTTVPADPDRLWEGARYGLGLISTPLTCGGRYWGHGGTVPGFDTAGGIAPGGRRVQLVLNQNIDSEQAFLALHDAVRTALCEGR
ncbi:serine hydrolase domain-containing protein [Actinomadura sp. DC4]|uniref:serine hydrolase domain-containing protein n=1 Tax=Actinomadura sp. DC4 TaxID=3055069 RepID=UPI0025B07E9D|nr:serine hydrolase domain-containing protein [Actinomadura sp. DC4]MDN3357877.1 serine hydrolase domain-containing protein [Actinomadura sp. DC4]